MKKLIVKREMPFCKVGDVCPRNIEELSAEIGGFKYFKEAVDEMVHGGWLEWRDDIEKLENKFKKIFERENGIYISAKEWRKCIVSELAGCAKKHYIEVYEKAMNEWGEKSEEYQNNSLGKRDFVRKALDNA